MRFREKRCEGVEGAEEIGATSNEMDPSHPLSVREGLGRSRDQLDYQDLRAREERERAAGMSEPTSLEAEERKRAISSNPPPAPPPTHWRAPRKHTHTARADTMQAIRSAARPLALSARFAATAPRVVAAPVAGQSRLRPLNFAFSSPEAVMACEPRYRDTKPRLTCLCNLTPSLASAPL